VLFDVVCPEYMAEERKGRKDGRKERRKEGKKANKAKDRERLNGKKDENPGLDGGDGGGEESICTLKKENYG